MRRQSGIRVILVTMTIAGLAVMAPPIAAQEAKAGTAHALTATSESQPSAPTQPTEMQAAVGSFPQRASVLAVPITAGHTAMVLSSFRSAGQGWIIHVAPPQQDQCDLAGPSPLLRVLCISW